MRWTERANLLVLLVGAALGGAVVGRMTANPAAFVDTLICRPSKPHVAYADANGPVVLMWGNSLLFDHDWVSLPGDVVNCARQGMTAARAQGLTTQLPAISPSHVLLAFGSVEAFRAGHIGEPVVPRDIAGAVGSIAGDIAARWPDAQIVLTHVPDFQSLPIRSADVAAINEALNGISDVHLLDLNAAFGNADRPRLSHDGVHPGQQAYAYWETALRGMMATAD